MHEETLLIGLSFCEFLGGNSCSKASKSTEKQRSNIPKMYEDLLGVSSTSVLLDGVRLKIWYSLNCKAHRLFVNSDLISAAMKTYNEKRNFDKTSEPKGELSKSREGKPIFVIQKHDATNLHYDFRLEIDGTLKSWSVPKGPSTSPSIKRMAIPTEDHPLAYADFEGIIPQGEYGGGTVMIWDRGTIESIKKDEDGNSISLEESYKMGSVEVELKGTKLKGGYTIVRMKGGKMRGNWLLIKQDDSFADARKNPVEKQTTSVVSGRSLEEIAKGEPNKIK